MIPFSNCSSRAIEINCTILFFQDLFGVLKVLVQKGWFTMDDYNLRLREFKFSSYDATDKPQDIPHRGKKMPGKAVTHWVHMRNFPLIIKPLVQDADDEILNLALLLGDLTSRITALEFKEHEIVLLEEKIIEYLDIRKELFCLHEDLGNPKPKHHLLTHYGQSVRLFGPPLSYWTGRFESKHRIAKNVAETAKNFKNISLTVSVRQQMRMASVYYRGMFETRKFIPPQNALYKGDITTDSGELLWVKVAEFMNNDDLVCDDVIFMEQKYQKNDLVVLQVLEDGDFLRVGLIVKIVIKRGHVFFVLRKFDAVKEKLGYYQSLPAVVEYSFAEAGSLVDPKPLIRHGTDLKFQFVLHHNVSAE